MITRYSNSFDINYVLHQNHGGLICYIKLLFQYYSMIFKNQEMFNFYQILGLLMVSIIKTPYWLLIKPFGYFFSSKRTYKGKYQTENDKIVFSNVKKTKIFFLIGIPYFFYIGKPNQDDWKNIRQK